MPIRDYTDSPGEGHGLKIQCPYLESEDLKSGKRNRVIGNLKRKEDYLESRLRSSPGARAAGAGRAGGGAGRVHTLRGGGLSPRHTWSHGAFVTLPSFFCVDVPGMKRLIRMSTF